MDLMEPGTSDELAASFRAFCSRAENLQRTEQAQLEEAIASVRARERAQLKAFHVKMKDHGVEQVLEPYMRHPVLKRLVCSLGNDPERDLAQWASNPEVIAMLDRALALPVKELEHLLMAQLKAPDNVHAVEFREKARAVAVLSSDQLASALNEALSEKRAGEQAMHAGHPTDALPCFQRGLAICNVVNGASASDQEEVQANKVDILLSMSAALLALHQPNAAAASCTEVLALHPLADPEASKAHLLRAEARLQASLFSECEQDLLSACKLTHSSVGEANRIRHRIKQEAKIVKENEARLYKRMFGK